MKVYFSKVERYMARKQYKSFVLDADVPTSNESSNSDNNYFRDNNAFKGELKHLEELYNGMHRPIFADAQRDKGNSMISKLIQAKVNQP